MRDERIGLTPATLDVVPSPCDRCPRAPKKNWLQKLFGIRPIAVSPYCAGRGPERIIVGGVVEVDYRTGYVDLGFNEHEVCPVDVTREMLAASTRQQMLVLDRYEEAFQELEERKVLEELPLVERMTVVKRDTIVGLPEDF